MEACEIDLDQKPVLPRSAAFFGPNRALSRHQRYFRPCGRLIRVKQFRSQIRKFNQLRNPAVIGRCKIGAALPPQESTAPTKSPSPEHPDEVGADIIEDELWPAVGSKLASHILTATWRTYWDLKTELTGTWRQKTRHEASFFFSRSLVGQDFRW